VRHVVVMVATSYPRFPGDGVGSFMAPIAEGVAARGHEVHMVLPWHPAITLPAEQNGVHFHFFKYAPTESLAVFGYAGGLKADTALRGAAWAVAPLALVAGWRTARQVAMRYRATIMHGHWVIPGGLMAAAARRTCPLVVSLHGSDVFVAERNGLARRAARATFARAGWVTACSDDLRTRAIALGAAPERIETVPYGVDAMRFRPDPAVRLQMRRELGLGDQPLVVSAGRLVSKKGFEYLIDAAALMTDMPDVCFAIAGDGDLRQALVSRAPLGSRVRLLGNRSQDDIARLCAAADVIAVPSIRDDAGNVDGLPNFALEALASATPVVATRAGGLPQAIEDGVTGRLVAERDAVELAQALRTLFQHPDDARRLGAAARAHVKARFGWARTAERIETAYENAVVLASPSK
jgi:glycosyltransferase involved in cell wall biosynthesis